MPDLTFKISGVEAVARGLTPLLHFKLKIDVAGTAVAIQALLLNAQIQIQCPLRKYDASEKDGLVDLFGPPERWGKTLRNRLWTHATAIVGAFTGSTEVLLPVACTYDLNIAAAKYFYALGSGEVFLLFLFSGSIFYTSPEAGLQVERISWNKECSFRIPVRLWRELMEKHYPNSAWLSLRRDVFNRLYACKRHHGHATWEQTLELLLTDHEPEPVDSTPAELCAPHSQGVAP